MKPDWAGILESGRRQRAATAVPLVDATIGDEFIDLP